ncbi:RVP_2 domain-containing protein [Gossypium australe]|uniref:RVP_2 domain-containing protein n=1 Tax=Gossypium australe TaxID=47621 RepID=A0A5B6WVH0_9ROSI|nr:RVP_2 domain-containing protein [Gossypium australe]
MQAKEDLEPSTLSQFVDGKSLKIVPAKASVIVTNPLGQCTMVNKKMIVKGGDVYLVYVLDSTMVKEDFKQVPVVNEFSNVVPEEILGILPNRDIKFSIDVTSGTVPILSAPYRMVPIDLKELKTQLQ